MKKVQSRVWLVVAVIATLLFVGILANPRLSFKSIPLEQLITAIEEGHVNEVVVRNQTDVTAFFDDGTQIRTTKPADMNLLAEVDIQGDLGRALRYREQNNPTWVVLRAGALIILPLTALTALYIFYIGRVNAAKATPTKS
jgi:hypothetical protein